MSEKKTLNLVRNKAQYLAWIGEIDRAVQEIATKGVASATVTAGGGTKSYTRLDIDDLLKLRGVYGDRVEQIKRRLAGVSPAGIRRVEIVRS